MSLAEWDAARATERADDLGKLLCDIVNAGEAVGFVPPLSREQAWAHWVELGRAIASGEARLLVMEEEGRLLGTVVLSLWQRADAQHRAEVETLMVRTLSRQLGIGRRLMTAAQALAQGLGRTTLTLQVRSGERAERLFGTLGWLRSGEVPRHTQGVDGQLQASALYHLLLPEPAAGDGL